RAVDSPLYRRVHDGEMPPAARRALFAAGDRDVLRRWIDAGAPAWRQPAAPTLTSAQVRRLVRDDLAGLPERRRPSVRHRALGHWQRARALPRRALAKLVNGLSCPARLGVPAAIDPGRLVVRLDLRDYRWNPRLWERLAALDPYRHDDTG